MTTKDTEQHIRDILKALRDQREAALDALASVNADLTQAKRLIDAQAKELTELKDPSQKELPFVQPPCVDGRASAGAVQ